MWPWIVGVAILAAVAVTPLMLARRQVTAREFVTARDRARSAMSRLEFALDSVTGATGPGPGPADDRTRPGLDAAATNAEAHRCLLLAGSALGGKDTADKFRLAADWATKGLRALGVDPPPA